MNKEDSNFELLQDTNLQKKALALYDEQTDDLDNLLQALLEIQFKLFKVNQRIEAMIRKMNEQAL